MMSHPTRSRVTGALLLIGALLLLGHVPPGRTSLSTPVLILLGSGWAYGKD
jgi:hypothetical protein